MAYDVRQITFASISSTRVWPTLLFRFCSLNFEFETFHRYRIFFFDYHRTDTVTQGECYDLLVVGGGINEPA